MPRHTVQQGDSIVSLSTRYGISKEKIWDHPDNGFLRERGRKPGILKAGEEITIPELETREVEVETGQSHRFRCRMNTWLKVRLLQDNEPMAGEPYVLTVGERRVEGSLDEDGWLRERVRGDARQAVALVGEEGQQQKYVFKIGNLDPIDEPSGIQQRLNNLGLHCGRADGDIGPKTRAALGKMQQDNDQDPTGEADENAKRRLRDLYGS